MKLHHKIRYEVVTDFERLKALMAQDVLGLDFEFTQTKNGETAMFVPNSVGFSSFDGTKVFKLQTKLTPHLLEITDYERVCFYLLSLAKQFKRAFIVFGPNDVWCLNAIYLGTDYLPLPTVNLYNVQPVLSLVQSTINGQCMVGLYDTAASVGIDTSRFKKHYADADAALLLELADLISHQDDFWFRQYKQALFEYRFVPEKAAQKKFVPQQQSIEWTSIQNKLTDIRNELKNARQILKYLKTQPSFPSRLKRKKRCNKVSIKKCHENNLENKEINREKGRSLNQTKCREQFQLYLDLLYYAGYEQPLVIDFKYNGRCKHFLLKNGALSKKERKALHLENESIRSQTQMVQMLRSLMGAFNVIFLIDEKESYAMQKYFFDRFSEVISTGNYFIKTTGARVN